MSDFEIEDFDASGSYENKFSTAWTQKPKSSGGGFFGSGGIAGGEDDMYNFEYESAAPKKGSKKSYSPESSPSPVNTKGNSLKSQSDNRPPSVAASTESAIDRANNMLAKYSSKGPAATSSLSRSISSKKLPRDFDEDEISFGSEDDDEFEVSASPGDYVSKSSNKSKLKPAPKASSRGAVTQYILLFHFKMCYTEYIISFYLICYPDKTVAMKSKPSPAEDSQVGYRPP